jgi:DNA-binding transcriptional LysR family regulator
MLLVESGVGVAILDSNNAMIENSSVKFLTLEDEPISNPSTCLVYHQDNTNQIAKTFIDTFISYKKQKNDE